MKDFNLKYNHEYYEKLEFGLSSEIREDHKRILKLLRVKYTDKVLEIGCGFGVLLKKSLSKKR